MELEIVEWFLEKKGYGELRKVKRSARCKPRDPAAVHGGAALRGAARAALERLRGRGGGGADGRREARAKDGADGWRPRRDSRRAGGVPRSTTASGSSSAWGTGRLPRHVAMRFRRPR